MYVDVDAVKVRAAAVDKYDKKISTHLSVYCWLQFVLVVLLYEAILPMLDVRHLRLQLL